MSAYHGVKCAWVDEQGCMTLKTAKKRLQEKTISVFKDNTEQCDALHEPGRGKEKITSI